MVLRIKELRNGTYIIQRRSFLFWWVMATNITDGAFDEWSKAMAEAKKELMEQRHKKKTKTRTWKVEP